MNSKYLVDNIDENVNSYTDFSEMSGFLEKFGDNPLYDYFKPIKNYKYNLVKYDYLCIETIPRFNYTNIITDYKSFIIIGYK